jgi:hypothetical protein
MGLKITGTDIVNTSTTNDILFKDNLGATKLKVGRDGSLRDATDVKVTIEWAQLTGIPSTFAPSAHTHTIANITSLQAALDAKAALASPSFTGTPIAPTAAAGTNTTQLATTSFVTSAVSTAVSGIVDSSPAALDTLKELATALGNDANFSTTISTALGNRLRVDISNQGLTVTQQGNARTNLGLGTAATANTGDFAAASHTHTAATTSVAGFMSAADKTKLDGIASGATAASGTVTSVSGTGSVSGLTLSGTVTSSGSLTLGGTLALTSANVTTALGFTPYNATNPSGYITSASNITGTSAGVVRTVSGTASAELVRGNMGDNDQARILVGATASNAGFLEISTADDGTEPIYVRQYTGTFTTLARTATLLDGSGNTSFPGTVTASTFSGALSGNATTATTLQTARSINGTSFNGSGDITTANWGSARTITIGATGKSVNGSGNISWSLGEIQAEYEVPLNTLRNNLGSPTVREAALFHGQFNNKFRFLAPTLQEESIDGTTWVTSTRASANTLADIMLGEGQSSNIVAIPSATVGTFGAYRLTWSVVEQTGYVFLNALYVWNSTNGNTVNITIERFHNTNGWETVCGPLATSNWPGHAYIPHSNIPYSNAASQYSQVRVTFTTTHNTNTNAFNLYGIEWFGGYPQGRRNVESYDRDKNVYFPNSIQGSRLISTVGTGTAPLSVSSTTVVGNLNADMVDGYHSSSLWRSDGAVWNPSANILLNQTANNQEWSFDITRNGFTGGLWHVWDSARSTMLGVDPVTGKVSAPYNFVGNLEGNSTTATTLQTARTIGGVSFNGSANINLPGVNTTGNQNTTGSAATLTTARTINGVSFNGSADITITAAPTAHTQSISTITGIIEGTTFNGTYPVMFSIDGNTRIFTHSSITYTGATNTLTAPNFSGALTGNATTATTLQTARTLTIGGTGKTFNGSANVSWSLAEIGAYAATNPSGYATTGYVDSAVAELVDTAPDSLNTLRELAAALGEDPNFATTVTNSIATKAPLASPALTGTPTAPTAATATNTTQIATTAFVKAQGYSTTTGTVTSVSGTGGYGGLTLTGTVTSSGSLTLGGTPTGTWPISVSGNAATATTANRLTVTANDTFSGTYPILWHDGTTVYSSSWMTVRGSDDRLFVPNITASGNVTAATFTGALSGNATTATTATTTTGNAGSATVLQTARTINGTSFNGSADITTTTWGAARTITIGSTGKSVNGGSNVSWTLAEIGAYAATNPSGYATTGYVDSAVANLIDTAPDALNTLNELAAALGDDPNFATTVTTNIAGKVSKTGDTLSGALTMAGTQKIIHAGFAGIEYYNSSSQWQGYIGTENNTGNLRYNSFNGNHTWYANGVQKMQLDASGNLNVAGTVTALGTLTVSKSGTNSTISFPAQTNDPGFIQHYELNNTSRMYFSVSDDNSTTDYFGFGYAADQTRFIIYSNGAIYGKSTAEFDGRVYADDGLHVRGDWVRVNGVNGLYFESYGGGWNMTDSTFIRVYGTAKTVYNPGAGFRTGNCTMEYNSSTKSLDFNFV